MGKNSNRDDFSKKTIEILCKRVNAICSNPECNRGTLAASSEPNKFVNTGVASHICAAAPGGPRYDAKMTFEQRSSIDNGIWLCQSCAKYVDSDEKKYTVELLHSWKEQAESRAQKGLVKPIYEPSKKDMMIFNIVESTQYNVVFNDEDRDNNYSDLYKDYINKFKENNNYLYSVLFDKNVKYSETDNIYTKFSRQILNWIIGKGKFPDCLNDFYNKLSKDYRFTEKSIIKKRWQANCEYFAGNVERAYEIYKEMLDKVINSKKIPVWFKDDIFIDGRNLSIHIDNLNHTFNLNNVFQDEINKNTHKLAFPVVDRIKNDIYEQSIKNIFNIKNKSNKTLILGAGIEYILNSIQDLTYIAILYGSITHLRLVRQVFSDIMYLYSDCYEDDEFYALTLKLKLLAGLFDDYKQIYNKIKYKYKFVNSKKFIGELYGTKKTLLSFDNNLFDCLFFEIYGRNVNEKQFEELENSILRILDSITGEINPDIVDKAFNSIPNNLHRMHNKKSLFQVMIKYIENNYSRFFSSFNIIINNIEINELTEQEKNEFVLLIKKCSDCEKGQFDLSLVLKKIKKLLDCDTYNLLCDKFESKDDIIKSFINNDMENALLEIVDFKISQAKQREKNPNEHFRYKYNYNLNGLVSNKSIFVNDSLKNKMLYLAKLVLLSKNQYAYEKKDIIGLLCHLIAQKKINKHEIKKIVGAIQLDSAVDFFDDNQDNNIEIYVMMLKFFLGNIGNIRLKEYLEKLLTYEIEKDNLLNNILDCINIIFSYYKCNKYLKYIYPIYRFAISRREFEITKRALVLSKLFINTPFFKEVEFDYKNIIMYNNYNEIFIIVQIVKGFTNVNMMTFENIIKLLENHENYNVRYITKQIYDN